MNNLIKIVHVNRSPVVRAGIRSMFENHPTIRIIAEAESSRQGVEQAVIAAAKILMTDTDTPNEAACFDDLRSLRERNGGIAAVLFTHSDKPSTFARAVSADIEGFLPHDAPEATIVTVLEQVAAGHRCRIPFEGAPESAIGASGGAIPDPARLLSQRELEIVRLIASGLSVKQVATALERSPKTVEAHKSRIMNKLQLHDRVGIARWAIREGLVEP